MLNSLEMVRDIDRDRGGSPNFKRKSHDPDHTSNL